MKMSLPKVINLLCLFTYFTAVTVSAVTVAQSCKTLPRCDDYENLVWATDGAVCRVFKNRCIYNTENCRRKDKGDICLITLPKDKCQEMCPLICPDMFEPFCAEDQDGIVRTFSSRCVMEAHNCNTAHFFTFLQKEECPEKEPDNYRHHHRHHDNTDHD